jgi:hypothetical protein
MKANEFAPSKHQRQIVNRFNNFVQEGDESFEKDIASRQQENIGAKKVSSVSADAVSTSLSEPAAETSVSSEAIVSLSGAGGKKQKPRKPAKNAAADLRTRIRLSEYLCSPEITSWKHRLRVRFISWVKRCVLTLTSWNGR